MADPIGGAPKILQSKEVGAKSGGMDKKKKMELILLAVLIPFFLYLVFTTFFSGSKKGKPAQQGIHVSSAAVSTATPSVQRTARPEVSEEEDWGHSPFSLRRQDDEKAQEGPLQLQGIVFDNVGSAYAIVNRKIVKVGDRIADNTVKGITDGEVIFQSDEGVRITLRS